MNILIESVGIEEKEIIRNLLELDSYDSSYYDKKDVNNFGLYGYKYLDHYWTDNNRFVYLVKMDNKIAGFTMISKWQYYKEIESDYCISEFFILNKYRKLGIGRYVVKYILNKYKGKWQIGYDPRNIIGKEFWNNVIKEITNNNFEKIVNDQTHKYSDGVYGEVLIFEI